MFEMPPIGKLPIDITNKTMELAECKDAWFLDERFDVWCLEDIVYTPKATTPKFQRLSIFVPGKYMSAPGVVDASSKEVPVIFENNSAGYMQMPHTYLEGPRCYAKQYLEAGYIYVTCGNRGHESKDGEGKWVGKAPINLVDLKMAIRFLRHNQESLPGNYDKIISVGWSAGGAMSTLLAVTGDNVKYEALLKENGAFMEESDAVYAAQIYCPIIDLEHADLAYEWMFAADKESEDSPAGPAGVMDSFQEALSKKLAEKYVEYFNHTLKLKHPETGELLTLNEDGRGGSGYEYLMGKLEEAASIYLEKLSNKTAGVEYSMEDYLNGNYTYEKQAPMRRAEKPAGLPPSLGDLVARPPKGMQTPPPFRPPMMSVKGADKHAWLTWDGKKAMITSLDDYVLHHRRRMKGCTSFDVLANQSGENKVFGTKELDCKHFNPIVGEAIAELRERFPEEYEKYYEAYMASAADEYQIWQKYMINPFNFIGTKEKSVQAMHYRIRVGAYDADTSLSVGMTLACKLAEAGFDVDYQLVWDQPHSEADYPGEVLAWIKEISLS